MDIAPITSWILAILGIYLLTKLILVVTRRTTYAKMVDKVAGPYAMPLLGNAWDLWVPLEDIFQTIVKFGDGLEKEAIIRFWIGFDAYVLLQKPRSIETVLSSTKHITKADDYAHVHSWLGTGLLTSTGEKWRKHRKMLTPAFHFRILDDFVSVFNDQSKILVDILREKAKSEEQFNLYPYVTRCALDIICESTMGRHVNAQREENSEYVKAVFGMLKILMLRFVHPWLNPNFLFNLTSYRRDEKSYLKILHAVSRKMIEERKGVLRAKKAQKMASGASAESEEAIFGTKKRLAFLDLLLEASSEDGQGLTDDEIREEVDTFMFEGHDTTSAGINFSLYLLGRHSEVQRKVQEELDEVLGHGSETPITSAELTKLKYLEAVIKESLRLYPSVPLYGRKLKEALVIDGRTIPAETTVYINAYSAHRDPESFPDPEEFQPDRFQSDEVIGRHPFAYVPFSAGPRNCIGQKFAIMEEKAVLANVLRHYDIISHDAPADLKLFSNAIIRSVRGIKVSLKERKFN